MPSQYLESSLMPGEQIVHVAPVSLVSFIGSFFTAAIFLLVALADLGAGRASSAIVIFFFLFCSLMTLLSIYIRFKSVECALTSKRVVARFGFIRRETIDLDLGRTESIRLKQGILGRIFGFGSIVVSGAGNPQAPIPRIKQPQDFRKQFLALQEAAMNKAGSSAPASR
jgi:uncharacterized membrane protein YdbT with pleckstrin-like domain